MSYPLISVLMPVFNGDKYLVEAIESILNQTFTNFEFIIIDDGSNDKTPEILKQFVNKDTRIKVISNSENKGISTTLNVGLKIAIAPLIARMDADDFSYPNRLMIQYKFMQQNPDISVCGSALKIYESLGNICIPPLEHNSIKAMLLYENCLYHPSVIFKKSDVLNNGGYDDYFSGAEDYELWSRLSLKPNIRFSNIAEPLLRYRMHPDTDRRYYLAKQKKLMELIRQKLLKHFGFISSEDELKYHQLISADSRGTLADINNCVQWLEKVELVNSMKHVFPQNCMRQVIKKWWINFCIKLADEHLSIVVIFFKSKWISIDFNSLYQASRMFWRYGKNLNIFKTIA